MLDLWDAMIVVNRRSNSLTHIPELLLTEINTLHCESGIKCQPGNRAVYILVQLTVCKFFIDFI